MEKFRNKRVKPASVTFFPVVFKDLFNFWNMFKIVEFCEHFLCNQDNTIGTSVKTLGIQFRVFTDNRSFRNPASPVDNNLLQLRPLPYFTIRQNDYLIEIAEGLHSHFGKQDGIGHF